ncbi:MAG: hypothetical protein WKF47_05540 [Geodermatophilaceae bacterium]
MLIRVRVDARRAAAGHRRPGAAGNPDSLTQGGGLLAIVEWVTLGFVAGVLVAAYRTAQVESSGGHVAPDSGCRGEGGSGEGGRTLQRQRGTSIRGAATPQPVRRQLAG